MKGTKKILFCTLAFGMFLMIAVLSLIFWSIHPTKGVRIDTYSDPHSAILVIDIQEDYTGEKAKKPYHLGEQIIKVSNSLLSKS